MTVSVQFALRSAVFTKDEAVLDIRVIIDSFDSREAKWLCILRYYCEGSIHFLQEKEIPLRTMKSEAGINEIWVKYEPPQPSQVSSLDVSPPATAGGESFPPAPSPTPLAPKVR